MRSANHDRPEIHFKVAFDVLKSIKFVKICGFYDVTGNFELDFRVMGRLREGVDLAFFFLYGMVQKFADKRQPHMGVG